MIIVLFSINMHATEISRSPTFTILPIRCSSTLDYYIFILFQLGTLGSIYTNTKGIIITDMHI